MNKKNLKKDDRKENTSLYGEFITSYFAWIPKIKKERKKEKNIIKNKKMNYNMKKMLKLKLEKI